MDVEGILEGVAVKSESYWALNSGENEGGDVAVIFDAGNSSVGMIIAPTLTPTAFVPGPPA